jgi:putative multiple sugar transport system substrate-binding protein
MEVLSPYIEGGNLMIGSGQREQKQVWIENGDVQQAKYRMKNIVASYYAGERNLDAVICATDSLALGVVKGLDSSYGGDWPIVTGQGCDKENEEILKKGKQTMSLYKDSGELIQKTGELVEAILYGKEIEEQRFGDFTVVTGENYKEIVR